jgi:integrase
MLKENNVRQGFFKRGEFVAFRNALPEYFRPVVTFAYYTGWRKEEILSHKWNQVDLNARTVRLHAGTTKSDKGRLVILDGELLQAIQGQWERRKVAEIPGQSPTLLALTCFTARVSQSETFAKRGTRRVKLRDSRPKWCMTSGAQRLETWCALAYLNASQ